MKIFLALTCICIANAQVSSNWTTYGGDPQRSGWERTDPAITKDTVKDFQLLWKMKLENQPKGSHPITPPLIIGRLISYRGFKELAIVQTSSDVIYAIDADLGKIFWQRHLEYSVREPQMTDLPCAASAMPTMAPPPAGRGGGRGAPAPPAPNAAPGGRASTFTGGAGTASVYAISSDGRLHRLNTSTGDDMVQPVSVLPPNAGASNLNMTDSVIYTSTSCEPRAVWAIDLSVDPPKVTSFASDGTSPAIGTDGNIYVQPSASAALTALRPRELSVIKADPDSYERTRAAAGIWGEASSWQDASGTRWVLGPWRSPLPVNLKVTAANGPTPDGAIVAFKVDEQGGKTTRTPAWISRNLSFPQPPVIANGVLFALSSGEFDKQMNPKSGTHATLYALDAATGKELYSSRNLVTAPAALTGMTVANGRVYFGTTDGTLYAFGIPMEH